MSSSCDLLQSVLITTRLQSTGLTNHHSLLSSETIEIVSGSGKSFFVHSDIIPAQSQLRGRSAGRVATDERIDLSGWDDDTVGRFLQFLYVQNYHVPEQLIDGNETEGEEEDGGRGDRANTPDTLQSAAMREVHRYGGAGGSANIFLVHAMVYTLAQYSNVKALQGMAFERLKSALEGRVLEGSAMLVDVIELLEYVYSHDHTHPKEPIRVLVSRFVVNNIEKLKGREELAVLLIKEGSLSAELVQGVTGRLCDMKQLLEDERSIKFDPLSLRTGAQWVNTKLEGLGWHPISPVPGLVLPPGALFGTAVVLVVAIVIILFIRKTPQYEGNDNAYFEKLCKYYESHSWAGENFITVGGRHLREACAKYTPATKMKLLLVSGSHGDHCKYYETRSWAGADYLCSRGESLEISCAIRT